jgi:hypothetical protein
MFYVLFFVILTLFPFRKISSAKLQELKYSSITSEPIKHKEHDYGNISIMSAETMRFATAATYIQTLLESHNSN